MPLYYCIEVFGINVDFTSKLACYNIQIIILCKISLLATKNTVPRGIAKKSLKREGPCNLGASWEVCDSGVPPYDFLNSYGIFNNRFSIRNGRETA